MTFLSCQDHRGAARLAGSLAAGRPARSSSRLEGRVPRRRDSFLERSHPNRIMRNHYHAHHHHALARAAHHVVQHAPPAGPGGAWYVRAIESCSHFSVGWLLGGAGYLLGRLWLPVGLIAAGALAVLVWRVWGRHRLAAAGSWWELRLGEQVSRPALEAFTRTLAGGLPRRWFGASPWVALSVSSLEDRATCGLFISGGLSPAQVRASVEQALGSVTVAPEDATPAGVVVGLCG